MRFVLLSGLLVVLTATSYGSSGFSGHQFDGQLEVNPPFSNYVIFGLQNSSNLGSPLAVVGPGVEFSANFRDFGGHPWTLTADFQDNYQLVLQVTEPDRYQLGGVIWIVQWHFYGFDFPIAGVQMVSGDRDVAPSSVSFDSNDIWIAYDQLYPDPYAEPTTLEIQPVPEPATLYLLGLSAILCLTLRRAKPTPHQQRFPRGSLTDRA